MAFIGLLLVTVIPIVLLIAFGVALIAVGAFVQKKTQNRKLALIFKIIGYFISIPITFFTAAVIIAMHINS